MPCGSPFEVSTTSNPLPITMKPGGIFFSLFILLAAPPLLGQTPPGIDELARAKKFATIADTRYLEFDTARWYGEQAIAIFTAHDKYREEVNVRAGLGYVYRQLGDVAALTHNSTRAYTLASKHLEADDPETIRAANNYALILKDQHQDYAAARDIYEAAFNRLRKDVKPGLRGALLYNIGSDYFSLGDFRSADKYYLAAIREYRRDTAVMTDKHLAAVTESCRVKTATGNYAAAITIATSALSLVTPDNTSTYEVNRCRVHLAECYRRNGQATVARELLDSILTEDKTGYHRFDALYQLASIHLENKRQKSLESTLLKIGDLPIPRGIKQARLYRLKAELAQMKGQRTQALSLLQQAATSLCPQGTRSSLAEPCLEDNLSAYELNQTLSKRAAWLAESDHPDTLLLALKTYRDLQRVSDFARTRYQSKEAQLLLFANNRTHFEDALAALHKLAPNQPKGNTAEWALYFIEKSKSSLLRDELNAQAFQQKTGSATGLFDRLALLERQLAANNQRLASEAPQAEASGELEDVTPIRKKILQLERAIDRLRDSVAVSHPVFSELTSHPLPQMGWVRDSLAGLDGAFFDYFQGKEWMYVLCVTAGQSRFWRIPAEEVSSAAVGAFRTALKLENNQQQRLFDSLAFSWQESLLSSSTLPAEVSKLILSPDGALSYLPFAALLTDKPREDTPSPYLLRRYRVRMAYSASVLQLQQPAPPEQVNLLGVYPLFAGEDRYQPAVKEALGKLSAYAGTSLVGKDANKDDVLVEAEDYDVLLFASHAAAYDRETAGPSISLIDGAIGRSDLVSTRLAARLVILSACETGLGEDMAGEGIMSMARAFSYAGVNTVVTTLWKVPEGATMRLVEDYLLELAAGRTTDEALQRVQLVYLDDHSLPAYERSPYFWSGLNVVGAEFGVALAPASGKWKWLLVVGLVCCVGLLLWWGRGWWV